MKELTGLREPSLAIGRQAELPPEYRHEPVLALAGGDDGLDIVRQILRGAAARLNPELLMIEGDKDLRNPAGLLMLEDGKIRSVLARAIEEATRIAGSLGEPKRG